MQLDGKQFASRRHVRKFEDAAAVGTQEMRAVGAERDISNAFVAANVPIFGTCCGVPDRYRAVTMGQNESLAVRSISRVAIPALAVPKRKKLSAAIWVINPHRLIMSRADQMLAVWAKQHPMWIE